LVEVTAVFGRGNARRHARPQRAAAESGQTLRDAPRTARAQRGEVRERAFVAALADDVRAGGIEPDQDRARSSRCHGSPPVQTNPGIAFGGAAKPTGARVVESTVPRICVA